MMKSLNSQLNIVGLISFFKSNNWNIIDSDKDAYEFSIFNDVIGKRISMFIPKNQSFIDFNRRVSELISVYASLNNMKIDDVISNILKQSLDSIRASISPWQISLEEAFNRIKALRKLILFSASSEIKQLKNFDNPIGAATSITDKFEFGHTFEGSFGFVVSSNIEYSEEQLSFFKPPTIPLQRKAVERIVVGLNDVQSALKNNDIDIIISNYEHGLNAKMCDALLDFSNNGAYECNFKVSWSSFIETPLNKLNCKWLLNSGEYEIIREASRLLQEVEPTEIVLPGKIVTLHTVHDIEKSNDFIGTAYLKTILEERTVDVKMSLNKYNYKKALEAHMKAIEVSIKGELIKNNTVWELINILWEN